jgi:hypothetical protein
MKNILIIGILEKKRLLKTDLIVVVVWGKRVNDIERGVQKGFLEGT